MTTVATHTPAGTERARFANLLGAEWIKLWSLRSTPWVLGLGALVIIGGAVSTARGARSAQPSLSSTRMAAYDPTHAAFPLPMWLLLMFGAGAIGALTVVGEYASGLIRTTFTAVPARWRVFAAKTVVVAGVLLVIGVVVAACSLFASEGVLSGLHVARPLSASDATRAIAGSAVLVPGCALVGMGIGTLIRHVAATIVAIFVVLLLLPVLFSGSTRWVTDVAEQLPFYAWSRLLMPTIPGAHAVGDGPTITITHAWVVLAVWPVVAAIVTAVVAQRRDV